MTANMNMFITIPIEVYQRHVLISIGQSDEALLASLKQGKVREAEKELKSLSIGRKHDGRGGVLRCADGIIRLQSYDDADPYLRGLMAHEIHHCVFKMLDRIGFVHHHDSDEAYAYLTGYIHQEFLAALISINNKLSNP